MASCLDSTQDPTCAMVKATAQYLIPVEFVGCNIGTPNKSLVAFGESCTPSGLCKQDL